MSKAVKQAPEDFQEKVGLDRRGALIGSRITPVALLALAIMLLFAGSYDPYNNVSLHLITVARPADIPASGSNLVIVARHGDTLHFRVFGKPETKSTSGRQLVDPARQDETLADGDQILRLKYQLRDSWGRGPEFGKKEKARIIEAVLSLTGVPTDKLVQTAGPGELRESFARGFDYISHWVADLLRTASSDGLRETLLRGSGYVSSVMLKDVPAFLGAQFKTGVAVLLLALIPGIGGMVYRRAFKQWFLLSFVVLGVINWSTDAAGLGSISGHFKRELSLPYGLYLWLEAILIVLLLGYRLRRHSAEALGDGQGGEGGREAKNIVVCIDGTWNHPGQTDYGYLADTNVFKLFDLLQGTAAPKSTHFDANRCKILGGDGPDTPVRQIGFYYNGVGNQVESSALGQIFGGAFGIGAEALKERAYLDVVRVYRPGDRVFIVGFSRGAAIARLLAAALGRRGAPSSLWTFRAFGRMLPVWKSSRNSSEQVPVKVLGCWDTVGAFGISKNILGIKFQQINLLKDLTVAEQVERAYHMVALDETRDSFEPTLMEADPTDDKRIVEVWFSGIHSNVGGGYSTDGLSDMALDFFLSHVSSGWGTEAIKNEPSRRRGRWTGHETWGLYLRGERMGEIEPDPMCKLRFSTGPMFTHRPRRAPLDAIISDFVFDRLQNPRLNYAPQSLFNLIEEYVGEREKISQAAEKLKQTGVLDDDQGEKVQQWLEEYKPKKWSESPLRQRLNPKEELANPFFLEDKPDPAKRLVAETS